MSAVATSAAPVRRAALPDLRVDGAALVPRFLLLAGLYLFVSVAVLALLRLPHDWWASRPIPLFLAFVLAFGFFPAIDRVRRVPSLAVVATLLGIGAAAIATMIGVLAGQGPADVGIGFIRLAFYPAAVFVFAANCDRDFVRWVRVTYVKHARRVYTVVLLVIGWTILNGTWGGSGAAGVDPILLGASLGFDDEHSPAPRRSLLDFLLVSSVAALSLKRNAVLQVVLGVALAAFVVVWARLRRRRLPPGTAAAVGMRVLALAMLGLVVISSTLVGGRFLNRLEGLGLSGRAADPAVEIRVLENLQALALFEEADLSQRFVGRGSGYRFTSGAALLGRSVDDTGALHSFYLTGLILGGVLWLASIALVTLFAARGRPPPVVAIPTVVLLLALTTGSGHIGVLGPALLALSGMYVFAQREPRFG